MKGAKKVYDITLFEKHIVDIPVKTTEEPILLVPFGDVHWDSPNCATDVFDDFCKWAKKQENAYFIGMGDYLDFASTSERRAIQQARFHETTIENLELQQRRIAERFVKKTAFMRGRIIGLLEGNHYGLFSNGTTTTQHMVTHYNYVKEKGKLVPVKSQITAKYLGILAAIRIRLRLRRHAEMMPLDVIAFHGRSRAQTKGGSLNAVAKLALVADANIYLAGHNHGLETAKDQRLKLEVFKSGLFIKHREIAYVRTGSFLKSYVAGRGTYVVPRAYPPSVLGAPYIQVNISRPRGQHRETKLALQVTI